MFFFFTLRENRQFCFFPCHTNYRRCRQKTENPLSVLLSSRFEESTHPHRRGRSLLKKRVSVGLSLGTRRHVYFSATRAARNARPPLSNPGDDWPLCVCVCVCVCFCLCQGSLVHHCSRQYQLRDEHRAR